MMEAEPIARLLDPNVNQTSAVLDRIGAVLDQYVIFPNDECRTAVILWTAHTHVAGSFESTPRLAVLSAEPGSGKSRVLEITMELAPNAIHALNVTPGTMWRLIELASPFPTFFVDEVDTVFGRSGSGSAHVNLRAILNAGHRKGAMIPRCVGATDVKMFPTFAPVAMAGLGQLPETIMTRSIVIRMKRAAPGQEVKPFRLMFAASELKLVRDKLAKWARAHAKALEVSFPDMPVKDRQADVWHAPLAIAELAGPEWAARAVKACRVLTEDETRKAPSVGQALLRDLRTLLGTQPHIWTEDALQGLYGLSGDVKWAPEGFTARTMAKLLAEYDVRPVAIREGKAVRKGYTREALADAWMRYLPPETVSDDETNSEAK